MRLFLAASLLASATSMTAPAIATTTVPLIERTKLFGNPSKAQGRISPDGKWLSWTAPVEGVLNL